MTGGPPGAASRGLPSLRILERLRDEGRIAPDALRRAQEDARRSGEPLPEALIQLGAITESELLKRLAELYRTQFVSTEKLSKANIAPNLLRMVPRRLAERLCVFPVQLKVRAHVLSVIAADLEEPELAKQVQMVAEVRKVNVLVARPAAVNAMIAKHYARDPAAFASLLTTSIPVETSSLPQADFGAADDPFDALGGASPAAPPAAAPVARAPSAHPPPPSFTISAPDIMAQLSSAVVASPETTARPISSAPPRVPSRAPGSGPPLQGPGAESFLETLHVMVALLERDRGELRTHTADVARLARKACERMGMTESDQYDVSVAAYLHDIGKSSSYHLTALNVARYEGHRVQAQKAYRTPTRLFETTRLPLGARQALEHLYERYDGNGFPDRLAGKDIPLGARLLAVVETYSDLTTHPKNPYRSVLTPAQACEAVKSFERKIFDPTVCDVLRLVVVGDVKSKLFAERRTVLLVDPDPEETTILDMRLASAGYDVVVARDALEAAAKLASADIVITEVDLPGTKDGFELCRSIADRGHNTPVIFFTRRGDRESVNEGFRLGAADFLVKPTSPDVVVAKAGQLLARAAAAGGVTGSLREMSLPDVVQILANGRKNGLLSIEAQGQRGEVHFGDGQVWNASFGSFEGEEAFYRMLLLGDGAFRLDPSFRPAHRTIQESTDGLLLEGMRRIDESDHGP